MPLVSDLNKTSSELLELNVGFAIVAVDANSYVNALAILSLPTVTTLVTTNLPLYSFSETFSMTTSLPTLRFKIPTLGVTDTLVDGITPSPENI